MKRNRMLPEYFRLEQIKKLNETILCEKEMTKETVKQMYRNHCHILKTSLEHKLDNILEFYLRNTYILTEPLRLCNPNHRKLKNNFENIILKYKLWYKLEDFFPRHTIDHIYTFLGHGVYNKLLIYKTRRKNKKQKCNPNSVTKTTGVLK